MLYRRLNFWSSIFFLVIAIESLISLISLLGIPPDPKNSLFWGYSTSRLAVLIGFLLIMLISLLMAAGSWKTVKPVEKILHFILETPGNYWLVLVSAGILLSASLQWLIHPSEIVSSNDYYYVRLRPVLILFSLIGLQTMIGLAAYGQSKLNFSTLWSLIRCPQKIFSAVWLSLRQPKHNLPNVENHHLKVFTAGILLIIIFSHLPGLFSMAETVNSNINGKVYSNGDDAEYQILAVNLMHGYGFAGNMLLDPQIYDLDFSHDEGKGLQEKYWEYKESGRLSPHYSFYRAPGFPILLSLVYRIFGIDALNARRLLVFLFWLIALVILFLGIALGGWLGALAGGLAGLQHLNGVTPLDFERVVTEIPTAFWLSLFGLFFAIYLRKNTRISLIVASACLAMGICTRSNFAMAVPFLLLFMFLRRQRLVDLAILSLVIALPVAAWSIYASTTKEKLVTFTTQSEVAFPQFNNIDVLEGIGPQHDFQGEWNPGFVLTEKGWTLPTPYRNAPLYGENGWAKGLNFWKKNLTQLPRLFYLKLWKNFWYDGYDVRLVIRPVGLFMTGIAILLLSIGYRPPWRKRTFINNIKSLYSLHFQLLLVGCVYIFWAVLPFWSILVFLSVILAAAVIKPFGDEYILPVITPSWILAFVAGHGVVTILFGDQRFHEPVDSLLIFTAYFGAVVIIYECIKRNLILATLVTLSIFWKA